MMADEPEARQPKQNRRKAPDRQQRLNKALRENLLKRKQQSRSRQNVQTTVEKNANTIIE